MPNMKLIISIINFLRDQAKKESMNPDTQESLEVAVECLQTAYDLKSKDPRYTQHALPMSLEDIFVNVLPPAEEEVDDLAGASSNEPANKAEIMKNLGNNLMRSNQFSEAIRYYTAAIEIDNSIAVYYCNRAAAYSKLNDFQNAIKDCEKAVEIDPKYAKAYGRMGLAYTSLEQNDLAIKSFRKAWEIDPGNESYQSNLRRALEKEKPSRELAGMAGIGSVDWQTLFSNPAFRNMASTIMQDPNIMNALSTRVVNSLNLRPATPPPDANDRSSANPNPGNGFGTAGNLNLDMFIEAGNYFAAQMQAQNPELAEEFRQSQARDAQNQENKDSSSK